MSAHCPLCGSGRSDLLFEASDFLYGTSIQAQVVQCEQCGLRYLWPQATDWIEHYPDEYAPYVDKQDSHDIVYSVGYQRGLARKAKLASQYQTGPLLDIGCAGGQLLAVLRNYADGHPIWGMDISHRPVQKATRAPGVGGWVGTARSLPLASETLSVVTMWHVLEHLHDPLVILEEISRLLRKDGALILACPLVDSCEAEMFGRYWAGYDSPRHLFFYSRDVLRRLLRRTGFEVSEISGVVYGFNSAKISSAFWLRQNRFFRDHPSLLRALATLIGVGVAAATELISRIFRNRRSVGVFVAQRH
ncbi:MAG: class I SAM-dependent methyltransferase [bacterium]